MELSVAVQHHPARAELLPPLLDRLAGLAVEVVHDPRPDEKPATWRTYRRALEETPAGATHRLVIQDDAEPCGSFSILLERAVAAEPDRMLVLCVCGQPGPLALAVRTAAGRHASWAELREPRWIPAVAILWPVELAARALEWIDAQTTWPKDFTADDEIVMRAMRGIGEVALATVPSLVDHPDRVQSIISKKRRPGFGSDTGRSAVYFLRDPDPFSIDF